MSAVLYHFRRGILHRLDVNLRCAVLPCAKIQVINTISMFESESPVKVYSLDFNTASRDSRFRCLNAIVETTRAPIISFQFVGFIALSPLPPTVLSKPLQCIRSFLRHAQLTPSTVQHVHRPIGKRVVRPTIGISVLDPNALDDA